MKDILWYIAGIPVIILFSVLVYWEFSTWQAHGYRADYNLRQACIEVSPRSLELEEKCKALD